MRFEFACENKLLAAFPKIHGAKSRLQFLYTAISRKVVGKSTKVHAAIPKSSLGHNILLINARIL